MQLYSHALSFVVFVALVLAARTAHASAVISEVCWMGSDLSTADEWIEVAGVGESATDLTDWWLTSQASDGTERVIATFATGTFLMPGDTFIIANYAAGQSRVLEAPDLVTSGLSLPNTKLLLRLYDASGSLVDTVDDGIGAPFAGVSATGTGTRATMERIDVLAPGSVITNWQSARASVGIDAAAPLLGSPGFLHVDTPLPEPDPLPEVESTSSSSSSESSSESSAFADAVPASVYFSEIMANPIGSDDAEWIELRNFGSGAVDIAGWELQVGTKIIPISAQSASGYVLEAGAYTLLHKRDFGFTLPNAGGTISLVSNDAQQDSIIYPEAFDGISFGRLSMEDAPRAFCRSTPGSQNIVVTPDVSIAVQSVSNATQHGTLITAEGKTTLNLEGLLHNTSSAGALCSWNFGDGFTSASCNPPSHTFTERGIYSVLFVFQDACGTAVERQLIVEVREPPKTVVPVVPPVEQEQENSEETRCIPSENGGVVLSEFLPNPAGDDAIGEWIELANPTSTSIDLCGWSIDDGDGGSASFSLDAYAIAANGFLLLHRNITNIALNNDGDSVRLLAPDGMEKFSQIVEYTASKEALSYAMFGDSWHWEHAPTPGTQNLPKRNETVLSTTSGAVVSLVAKNPKKPIKKSTITNTEQNLYTKKISAIQNALTTHYENVPQLPLVSLSENQPLLPVSHRNLARFLPAYSAEQASSFASDWWLLFLVVPLATILVWKGSLRS
jgi:PKD repeat protein